MIYPLGFVGEIFLLETDVTFLVINNIKHMCL